MSVRALVVCTPAPGHVNPLRPLIEALLAGGDQVIVAAAADTGSLVDATGATLWPSGHGEDMWFEQLKGRIRGVPGDGLAPGRINHYFLPRLFGEIAAPDMIDDVLSCGRQFDPDLVIFESCAFAGPLAADLLGVPGVHHHIGPIPDHQVLELVSDAVSPLWRSFGRNTPSYAGVYRGATIEICPPSLEQLQVPSGDQLALRPVPPGKPAVRASERPVVYVTFGTFFNANQDLFRVVLAGLADEPLEVVVTVGRDQDPGAVAPAPVNARVERYISQRTLLPSCSAVVHHGGAGTTFGALAHGLPQVVIPQGADNFVNAAMLKRAGVAVVLPPEDVSPQNVLAAVRRIREEPIYATAARKIAAEIAVMPDSIEVANSLRAYGRS